MIVLAAVLTFIIVAGGVYFGYELTGRFRSDTDTVTVKETAETEAFQETAYTDSRPGEASLKESETQKAMVLDVSDIVKEVMPSIVAITNKSVQEVTYMFRGTMEIESESSGSGIIIGESSTELLIATNYHVIEDASTLTVCFTVDVENEEDSIIEAVVKGSNDEYDLAVVAIPIENIPPDVMDQISFARFGSSSDLMVGEPVIAIGNALGYGQSVTVGIVSALNRSIEVNGVRGNYIQTDAAINFGNSGGALFNAEGELIGINSAKAASSGVEGMGYAIPIDDAEPVLAELMNRETREKVDGSEKGYLGVYTEDISSEARNLYEIPNGVYVSYVENGSPAEEAGLQRGDIISSMDGITITSTERFEDLQQYYRESETIDLEILRSNMGTYSSITVKVTLGRWPEQNSIYPYTRQYGFGNPY